MYVEIKDAPFSKEKQQTIQDMGFSGGDWGHPDVVLDDPVSWFMELQDRFDALPIRKGVPKMHYEKDAMDDPNTPQPFGE